MCSLHLVRSIHFAKHQADSHSIVLKIKWVLLLCALQFLLWMEWFRIFRKSLHWILASTRSSADGSLCDDRHSTKLSDVCLVDLFTLPLHLGDIISRCHYHIFIAPSSNCPFQCCTCVTCVCVHVQRVSVFKPCPREYSSPCSYFSEKRSKRRKCLRHACGSGAARANRISRNRKGYSSATVSLARAYAIRERLWKFNLFITSCNFLFILSYHIRYSFIVYSFLRWRRLPYLWLCNIVIKSNEIKWEIKKWPGDWDLCKFAISHGHNLSSQWMHRH